MRKLIAICVFALVVAMTVGAYAEVQNVKVSGDITTRVFNRSGYPSRTSEATYYSDVLDHYGYDNLYAGQQRHYFHREEFVMTNARLRVDADLTDNVSVAMVLTGEKDWGVNRAVNIKDEFNVDLEKAYVTLKEFFYQPLTIVVGRQNLWFGKGFVVGYNRYAWDLNDSLTAQEFSTTGTFDAIRATLDFNPWTIDFAFSTLENYNDYPSRIWQKNMLVSNVGYKFSEYNADMETYYAYVRWNRGEGQYHQDATMAAYPAYSTDTPEERNTQTIGLRGSIDPVANITLYGEAGFQWGKYNPADEDARALGWYTADTINTWEEYRGIRRREAWAVDVGAEYRFSDYAWQPKLGGEYIFYSGDRKPWATDGKYKGWDMVNRGKFDTAIADFLGVLYQTADRFDPAGGTNRHQFAVEGSIRPIEALEIYSRYTYLRLHRSLDVATVTQETGYKTVDTFLKPPTSRSKDFGHEIDVKTTYDYTEDVQFSMLSAWFLPGDYYKKASEERYYMKGTVPATADEDDYYFDTKSKKTIHQYVGSVKVSF